jgi:hypothetical protein
MNLNHTPSEYRKIVSSATPAQIEQATKWYLDAELLAHDIVSIFRKRGISCNLENAASVISSFSPRQRWSRNVVQALEFAHGGEPAGLKNNLRMAQFSMVDGFKALNGLKTNSFARNISGDENAVTIDVWMIKAAGLKKDSVNKTEYNLLSDAVRDVATEFKLTPRTTQALIWIVFRGSAE